MKCLNVQTTQLKKYSSFYKTIRPTSGVTSLQPSYFKFLTPSLKVNKTKSIVLVGAEAIQYGVTIS